MKHIILGIIVFVGGSVFCGILGEIYNFGSPESIPYSTISFSILFLAGVVAVGVSKIIQQLDDYGEFIKENKSKDDNK